MYKTVENAYILMNVNSLMKRLSVSGLLAILHISTVIESYPNGNIESECSFLRIYC